MFYKLLAHIASHGGWKILEFCALYNLPTRWYKYCEPLLVWINARAGL